jgi:hypothetical protein
MPRTNLWRQSECRTTGSYGTTVLFPGKRIPHLQKLMRKGPMYGSAPVKTFPSQLFKALHMTRSVPLQKLYCHTTGSLLVTNTKLKKRNLFRP